MIRGAVIHFSSEQPLVCDLRALPQASDAGLVVTNLRYVDGRKPTFIDHADSWFVFPLVVVRFIEIPADAMDGGASPLALPPGEIRPPARTSSLDDEPDDAPDVESLLQRMREA